MQLYDMKTLKNPDRGRGFLGALSCRQRRKPVIFGLLSVTVARTLIAIISRLNRHRFRLDPRAWTENQPFAMLAEIRLSGNCCVMSVLAKLKGDSPA
jgi:hypothetical protein